MGAIKNTLLNLLLIATSLFIFSCETDDYPLSLNDKDQTELKNVKSFEIRPGNGKALIKAIVDDPKVSEVKISWDEGANSVSIPVSTSTETDTVSEIIENLQEKIHVFEIQTIDETGKSSKTITGGVDVYGSNFINSSRNRELTSNALINSRLELDYAAVANTSGIIGTEITYKNTSGENQELFLNTETNSLNIEDFKSGSTFKYRSVYVASPMALDTIYTAYDEFKPEAIPVIAFVTDDSNDDEQIEWLRENGFYVFIYYNSTFSTAPETDIDRLNEADLIIVGRSGASADFGGDQKASWNALTAPLILNSQWVARSNRINWFDNVGNPIEYAPGTEEIINAKIMQPEDIAFEGITLSDENLLPWLTTPNNILYTNETNGEVLAVTGSGEADNEEGGAALFVRFEAGMEFYDGAGESAAGPRTFFGFGVDFEDTSYYFPLTDEVKQVYLNEINRNINISNTQE